MEENVESEGWVWQVFSIGMQFEMLHIRWLLLNGTHLCNYFQESFLWSLFISSPMSSNQSYSASTKHHLFEKLQLIYGIRKRNRNKQTADDDINESDEEEW